jgi:glycosyltransferase involved in cell wall biosynthesis
MVDKYTDFFEIVNNFDKTKHVESTLIIKSKLKFLPKVTIAIPTYKRADLLKEALDSAVDQLNYDQYDIVVVDNDPERDCETERLMATYSLANLSYYKNSENLGMAGNWNRLFSLAAGDFVVMLHDDDLLLPNFLEKSMNIISQNEDINLLKPRFFIFENFIKSEEIHELKKLDGKLSKINTFSFYSGCVIGAPTGAIFKKASVIKLGGFNPEFQPSLDFCFYVLFSKHYTIYHLNEYLVLYRLSQNESLKVETMQGFIKIDYYLISFILKQYKVPKFIVLNYLSFVSINRINYFKKELDSKFVFDSRSIEIKDLNLFMGKLSSKFLRVYDYSIKLVRLIKH